MELESLQLKRVTDWERQKTYVPKPGEYIFVESNDYQCIIVGSAVAGYKDKTLEELWNANRNVFPVYNSVVNKYIPDGIKGSLSAGDDTATTIVSENYTEDLLGVSEHISRSDHTHKLSKDAVEDTLYTDVLSSLSHRRISIGTGNPPNDGTAKKGDIFIQMSD